MKLIKLILLLLINYCQAQCGHPPDSEGSIMKITKEIGKNSKYPEGTHVFYYCPDGPLNNICIDGNWINPEPNCDYDLHPLENIMCDTRNIKEVNYTKIGGFWFKDEKTVFYNESVKFNCSDIFYYSRCTEN